MIRIDHLAKQFRAAGAAKRRLGGLARVGRSSAARIVHAVRDVSFDAPDGCITGLLGPMAQHVIVANAGHGVMQIGCMRDVVYRFIDVADDKEATAIDASCVKSIPRPPAFEPITLPAEAAK